MIAALVDYQSRKDAGRIELVAESRLSVIIKITLFDSVTGDPVVKEYVKSRSEVMELKNYIQTQISGVQTQREKLQIHKQELGNIVETILNPLQSDIQGEIENFKQNKKS